MEKQKEIPQSILDKLANRSSFNILEKHGVDPKATGENRLQQIKEAADKIFLEATEKSMEKMRTNLEKLGLPQQRIDELVNKVETGEINNDPAYIANNRRRRLVTNEINKRTDDTLNSLPNNSIVEEIRARINKSR